MLKQVTLLALAIGTLGVMAEAEAESGILPIPISAPPSIESSAVKAVEVAQVQGSIGAVEENKQVKVVEKNAPQENDSNSKRLDPPQETSRGDEPRQPEGVAKPNLPPNVPAPPKQISEVPRSKQGVKRGKQGDDEEVDESNEKCRSKNKKNGKDDNDDDVQDKPKGPNYTVPRRRTQMQGNDAMGDAVPGTVIGALVLFLVVALIQ